MEKDIFAPKQGAGLTAKSFQIIRSLGKGATGEVFLARSLEGEGRNVALKILENPDAFDDHTLKRFRDEVSVLRRLRHPNLIEAYDFFDYNGCLAFSMEHVDGNDLSRTLRQRRLNTDEVEAIILQVLDALHELHLNQILHRDIKLENVLLSKTGVVKVGDLGLMKRTDSKAVTRPGLIFGTAQYMAPEYVKRGIYDVRGEIYATGVMLLELLVGRRRMADVPENKMMETIIKSRFALPEDMLKDLPDGYRRIVERAMAINPDERYQNAIEMRYDLIKNRVQAHRESIGVLPECDVGPRVTWGTAANSSTRGTRVVFSIIFSALIGFVSYRAFDARPSVTIQQGVYRGFIRVSPDHLQMLKVFVNGGAIRFNSEELGCHNTVMDVGLKMLHCSTGKYRVEFDSAERERVSGFLVRKGRADVHEFKLEKTS